MQKYLNHTNYSQWKKYEEPAKDASNYLSNIKLTALTSQARKNSLLVRGGGVNDTL